MNTITEYFKQSELALASYANLAIGVPGKVELIDKGMSDAQATLFAATYSVAAQYIDATGLSATVFADAAGNRYLAIRGTDDVKDLATDIVDIALLGTTAFQSQYDSLKAKVTEWLKDENILGRKLEDGTVAAGSFSVTGHSLGGFLATGIAADFADNVTHTYLYNSPGVGGITGFITSPVLDALGIATTYDPAKISNIKAEAGISPIAELGYQVSPPVYIVIEDQIASDINDPPASFNHSQQVLTDALAVYAAFGTLDPALNLDDISAILKASTGQNAFTLEASLAALGAVFGKSFPQEETTRDALYTFIGGAGNDIEWRLAA